MPPNINGTMFPQSFGEYVLDGGCNPSNTFGCNFFHPGSAACYRSVNSFENAGQQCCYNANNQLQVGPPGGGTLDLSHSSNLFEHFFVDVAPFIFCKYADMLDLYYDKRPSDNGSRWRPPRPGINIL